MEVWVPNRRNRLKKVLLGSVPVPGTLAKKLKRPVPKVIQKVLEETEEDLFEIKKTYESLGVEVLRFPVDAIDETISVRNGFIVVDDHMYITDKLDSLAGFYASIDKKTFVNHSDMEYDRSLPNSDDPAGYCPNIFVSDEYAILDGLGDSAYKYWRGLLKNKRKIITAFNEGHSDGIYCNVADKIWLTNGNALNFKKYWPTIPTMELSTTNSGEVNHWKPVEDQLRELEKTNGRYMVHKHELDHDDMNFIDDYLANWVGYCEETLFDINMSVIDQNNVMAISQNSLVYDKLESLGVKVHKVPFRHRFFWDGGLHCITNDLVREK